MPLKTLLARTAAVLTALAAAAASVVALEPGAASAVSDAPQATTVSTGGTPDTVSGTVTNASGAAITGDTVTLIDGTSGEATPLTATTNTGGIYTISGVSAGTSYYVEFSGGVIGGTNYQAQYLGGSQVIAGSQQISLPASTDSVTGANATLLLWNAPGVTQTVTVPTTITQTVTTGTPAITVNQSSPAVTKTVTTPAKTTTITKTVTTTTPGKTTTTTTPTGTPTSPSVTSGSLGGIGARDVALKFKVVAGSTNLRSFELKLPKGFSFVSKKLKAGLKLGKLHFTYKLSGGTLDVTLKSAQKSFTASLGGGAITTTTAIVRNALVDKIASEKITLAVVDSKGAETALPFVIAKPS